MEKTPASRFLQQIEIAEMLAENDPIDYFKSGNAARWLLCIAQGLERLQGHCLAIDGVLVSYRS